MTNEHNEAVQNVVDRIGAYQDGAPEGTVDKELRDGLAEAGVELADAEIDALVSAIEAADGRVDVTTTLGSNS